MGTGRPRGRPRKIPLPVDMSLPEEVRQTQDPRSFSPLGVYLRMNNISDTAMARAVGTNFNTIVLLATGKQSPSLALAYEMERITKGCIPMEAWLAVPRAKKRMAELRGKQPTAVREIKSVVPPGGYARPMDDISHGKQNTELQDSPLLEESGE